MPNRTGEMKIDYHWKQLWKRLTDEYGLRIVERHEKKIRRIVEKRDSDEIEEAV